MVAFAMTRACHSMVAFAVAHACGVCLGGFWRQPAWPLCTSACFAVVVAFAVTVSLLMQVPVPFCLRVRNFGAACIFALLEISRSCQ